MCLVFEHISNLAFLYLQDFEREGSQPFKLAAIGGVSEFFG